MNVAIVRRSDGVQISGSCFALLDEVGGTPSECRVTKLYHEYICHETGKSSIAVRERMNGYNAVVEPNGHLIG